MNNVSDIDALREWNNIPKAIRKEIINNVFCEKCGTTSIKKGYAITQFDNTCLLLNGNCNKCDNKVCRVILN